MSFYVAIVKRLRTDCGRDKTAPYVHVVDSYHLVPSEFDSLDDWMDANPTHPWLNPNHDEYVVEIFTQSEFDSLSSNGLFYDNFRNLPKWQQKSGVTGSTRDFGFYATPGDEFSVFTSAVQVNDDRYIFRVFNQTPSHPLTEHVGEEVFNESVVLPVRYIEAYDNQGTVIDKNDTLYLHVGSQYLKLDFGTAHLPVLAGGVSSFDIDVSLSGEILLPSSYMYRFIGPDEGLPNYYKANIYGDTLRLPTGGE